MVSIGEGIGSPAIEQDPSVAQIQANQQGAALAAQAVALPSVGFVQSLNALVGLLTLQAGTSTTGITVNITDDGVATISIGVSIPVLTQLQALATVKTNRTNAAPGVNDDLANGYNYFSEWVDTTVPDFYVCVDPTNGAAVWLKLN